MILTFVIRLFTAFLHVAGVFLKKAFRYSFHQLIDNIKVEDL